MKCEDSLTKIEAYIHNKMSYRELEDFLEHVKECPDCYDELETYYTITVGMKYLEEERLEAYNIPQMLGRSEKEGAVCAPGACSDRGAVYRRTDWAYCSGSSHVALSGTY
ncbi:MAG: zf-HC2 domain-containing protein [Ruminococcus sp.]